MTGLPHGFKEVRLELAREKDHPEGARNFGYVFVAPLDANGQIDHDQWAAHRDACRVVRFRPDETDEKGHLVRKPGGSWAFRYDITGDDEDEAGYRFNDERFVVGEYVSLKEEEAFHTFRVVSVEPV
ncbi:hypothetical protein AZC_3568 [Azorhizobium caulinodans ORS 571]|uniref:Uncharacterized protein n=1 Tax=Azorhizobium caulinodans (strain ATCC 43989 / DSM 5975 / JCM 20966 / LMG 6465 / NBRC 14845 / NCIMB 13405 / ORS 571) TaxID=438753 RepID=A8IF28_AZOC5|nr:hypothetical protein [Azorhizobium]TDU01103.1 hypothetical protein DFO45_0617 [Azorhizobium sp. AG788]BAF89566.1 hypothetical protein AZC_3568 [Azorhizobium caulinodans ORS 571]